MISIYNIKPQFQNILRPVAKTFNKSGITANMVTIFAMVASIVFGIMPFLYEFGSMYWFCIPMFFFIRMALNAVDGIIAKEFDQITPLGAFLNELGDIVSDSALILAFSAFLPNNISLVIFALLASLTEAAGLCSKNICNIRNYQGPMGKSDRAFVLGGISVLIGFELISSQTFNVIVWILCLLALYTTYNRISSALSLVNEKK